MNDNLLTKGEELKLLLSKHREKFSCVIQPPLTKENTYQLNISDPENVVANTDFTHAELCWKIIRQVLDENNKIAAIGGYAEKRIAYRINPSLFGSEENERCIHLGVDIWMEPETQIVAPLDAVVHSFADNASLGNYGPTIILEHELEGISFYTLYGHLTRKSIIGLCVSKRLKQGEVFAAIGSPEENGHWPPHLHYQLITDLMGCTGDFIGVSTEEEAAFYLTLCPEPVVL